MKDLVSPGAYYKVERASRFVNPAAGIQWLTSFLSADKKKTYCLYEAPNPEAIREAERKLKFAGGRDPRALRSAVFPAAPNLMAPTRVN